MNHQIRPFPSLVSDDPVILGLRPGEVLRRVVRHTCLLLCAGVTHSVGKGTVTAGAVSVAPSLFTNDQLFYGPAITTAITVAPTLATNTQTFYAPTVTPGAVVVSPAYFENAQTFYAAELYRQGLAYVRDGYVVTGYVAEHGAVDLQPSLLTNAQQFYGPLVGRFSTSDLDFLVAYLQAHLAIPNAADIASAVWAKTLP